MASGREVARLVLVSVVLLLAAPAAATAGNRLINPGAEAGLTGWQGTAFGVTANDGTIKSYPSARAEDLEAQVFTSDGYPTITEMTQTVDLSDLASAIDSGYQDLDFGGMFGGKAGGFVSTSYLTVQPLNATGVELGRRTGVGQPLEGDREFNR